MDKSPCVESQCPRRMSRTQRRLATNGSTPSYVLKKKLHNVLLFHTESNVDRWFGIRCQLFEVLDTKCEQILPFPACRIRFLCPTATFCMMLLLHFFIVSAQRVKIIKKKSVLRLQHQ